MITILVAACCLLLAGCGPDATSPHSDRTTTPGSTRHPEPGKSATPTEPSADTARDAEGSVSGGEPVAQIRTACTLFAATFEQKLAEKFPNQRKAAELAREAARDDGQRETIAEHMTRILDVGERINLPGGAPVSVEESNAANQAVADLRDLCLAAGAEFALPAD